MLPASFGSLGPAITIDEIESVIKVRMIKVIEDFLSVDADLEMFFDKASVDALFEVNANSVYM